MTSKPGTLYLVATPIGNLEDITLRALRVLGEVDLIAAEDTRHTRKLLNVHGISRPLVSYHEHNMRTRGLRLIRELLGGKSVALVTDAGTPTISDPGLDLVRLAISENIPLSPIPGPSAGVVEIRQKHGYIAVAHKYFGVAADHLAVQVGKGPH